MGTDSLNANGLTEIDLVDKDRAKKTLEDTINGGIGAIIANNRGLLDQIPELHAFRIRALAKAQRDNAKTPQGFGPDVVADEAQVNEAVRIYAEYRKVDSSLDKMTPQDRSVVEIIKGLKPHEEAGMLKNGKLGWGNKDIFSHIDDEMPRIKLWHEKQERIFAAQMKALKPFARELFIKGYNGNKNSKLLQNARSEEIVLYRISENAIKQYHEIYRSVLPWNEKEQPYGTREKTLSNEEKRAFDALKKVTTGNNFSMLDVLEETEKKAESMEEALKRKAKPKPKSSEGAAIVVPKLPQLHSGQIVHS